MVVMVVMEEPCIQVARVTLYHCMMLVFVGGCDNNGETIMCKKKNVLGLGSATGGAQNVSLAAMDKASSKH